LVWVWPSKSARRQNPVGALLLAGAALTLALAIWSMHFVGMLAARLPVLTDFLVLPTLLSFLVCVLVVGIGVFAASNRQLTPVRLGIAAFVMGAGICTMHYLGMYALHLSLSLSHDTAYVLASFLIAFNASGLALWLLFGAWPATADVCLCCRDGACDLCHALHRNGRPDR
jgi:NO-binding membrane sensor protein with MHYT domain